MPLTMINKTMFYNIAFEQVERKHRIQIVSPMLPSGRGEAARTSDVLRAASNKLSSRALRQITGYASATFVP